MLLQVVVALALQELGGIKETEMSFSAKFKLSLTWHEHRVRWRGLRNNSNINRVPHFRPEACIYPVLSMCHTVIFEIPPYPCRFSKLASRTSGCPL